MRPFRYAIVGLSAVVLVGCLHAPVLWSPDGQWLLINVFDDDTTEAMRNLLLEKGLLTRSELEGKIKEVRRRYDP